MLKALWESVRKLDGRMADLLDSNHYSVKMDESIFSKVNDDEIVLCLNYDGLYGINNINKFLQNDNKSKFVKLEMDEIGYEDYFYGEGVCLIEWAELIQEILPDNIISVTIEKDLEKGFDYRKITIEGEEK